jgi:CBS domain-containing protein
LEIFQRMATPFEASYFWNDLKLRDVADQLPFYRTLITAHGDDSIKATLKKLKTNEVVSLPVFDRGTPLGRISAFDIAMFIADHGGPIDDSVLATTVDHVLHATREKRLEASGTVDAGAGMSIFSLDTPLSEALGEMIKGRYRLLVDVGGPESDKKLQNMSGRDIISFIFERSKQKLIPTQLLQTPLEKLVDAVPALKKEVQTAHLHDRVLDVLKRLATEKIGALPIVDDTGAIITTFSASDLRRLPGKNVTVWENESVGQYLKKTRQGHLRKPTTVTLEETLETAIQRLMLARVHRLWVAEKGAVSGLFSITHVFRVLHGHFSGHGAKAIQQEQP